MLPGKHLIMIKIFFLLNNDKDIFFTLSSTPVEFVDENFSLEGSTFEMKFSPKEEKLLNEDRKIIK